MTTGIGSGSCVSEADPFPTICGRTDFPQEPSVVFCGSGGKGFHRRIEAKVSEKVLTLVYELLPGFLAAWIFHGLTSHPKASEFERIVQAFVFTGIVKCLVMVLKSWLFKIGRWWPFCGQWLTEQDGFNADVIASFSTAVALGLVVSVAANKDVVHSWLRARGWTLRTSKPSELVNALDKGKGYITLNMKNGDLINGWKNEFPDDEDGYYVVDEPQLMKDGKETIDRRHIERMIVPAKEVLYVQVQRQVSKPDADPVPPVPATRQNVASGSENGVVS